MKKISEEKSAKRKQREKTSTATLAAWGSCPMLLMSQELIGPDSVYTRPVFTRIIISHSV